MEEKIMKRQPLYETVIERVYRYIDETQMEPGVCFPPERDLVQQWGVSRNVLREALHILEDRGILVSRQGQGRFLRSLPQEAAGGQEPLVSGAITRYSLVDLYEVRQCLEMKSVELAAIKATDAQIAQLTAEYRKMCATLFRLGTVRKSKEDQLHFKYLEVADNAYLEKQLKHQLYSLDEMFEKVPHLIHMHRIEDYVRDHGNILRAIVNHDTEEAQREMKRHIQASIDILKFGK